MPDLAPDELGEVVAFRAWRVIGTPKLPILASVTHARTVWHPQRWTLAECGANGPDCKNSTDDAAGPGVPGEDCSCGMYAARDLPHLVDLGYGHFTDDSRPIFVGEVGLVGKVIEGDQGWRAEKGRIRRLWVPWHLWSKYAAGLERLYDVPVEPANTFETQIDGVEMSDEQRLQDLAAKLRSFEGR